MQTSGSIQVPPQFSSVIGLGAPIRVFLPSAGQRWGSAIFGALFLGGSLIVALWGLYSTFDQVNKHGPAVFQKTIITPAIFTLIMVVIGIFLLWSAVNNWNKAVVLYQKGLAYNSFKGVQDWRWEDVHYFFLSITKHYYNGVPTGTTHIYTMQKADGSRLVLSDTFSKVEELGDAIQKNVFSFQYERIVNMIKQGQPVVLGPIMLNKDGIQMDKKMYAWGEVEQIGIQRGLVSIKKRGGGWFSGASTQVARIPNLNPLLAVVDQIVKVKAG